MTQRERYGLTFVKIPHSDGSLILNCIRPEVGIFSRLQIINCLDNYECQCLIQEIENAESGKYFEKIFSADASGNDSIEIIPPNIIINEDCIVPLSDMKKLLNEWISFRSA